MIARVSFLAVFAFLLSIVSATKIGQGTFFEPGEGACGHFNTAADSIVAVSSKFFTTFPGAGPNPNTNPMCNKQLKITYKGKTAKATVTDECPSCPGKFDLDMSPAVFNQLADPSVGLLKGISWEFI
ncbi:hypothetical protein PLICRDRAFT_29734 [Plicaturopsis crispa FD-325 SS-3]|nr:hypothetical protein PLICRDRAFT_29734 [Plicaturopsis crispa FD-325 SS-3]